MTDELIISWFPFLDIPAVLRPVMNAATNARYALVSRIDSTTSVASLPSLVPFLDSLAAFHDDVGGDVVIDSSTLLALVEDHDDLTGFDEGWLFAEMPSTIRPVDVKITSDRSFAGEVPAALETWMAAAGCCVGLGDGDGLNVATFDRRVANAIVRVGDGGQ